MSEKDLSDIPSGKKDEDIATFFMKKLIIIAIFLFVASIIVLVILARMTKIETAIDKMQIQLDELSNSGFNKNYDLKNFNFTLDYNIFTNKSFKYQNHSLENCYYECKEEKNECIVYCELM